MSSVLSGHTTNHLSPAALGLRHASARGPRDHAGPAGRSQLRPGLVLRVLHTGGDGQCGHVAPHQPSHHAHQSSAKPPGRKLSAELPEPDNVRRVCEDTGESTEVNLSISNNESLVLEGTQ